MRPSRANGDDFDAFRKTMVYAQSEELTLAEEPSSAGLRRRG